MQPFSGGCRVERRLNMHVITDENGNVIPHGHEHTHHDHDHHDHDHHEHDHGHEHCHTEECGSCGGCADPEKETIALVGYMVDHNKHHAMELADMAKKLREMGKTEAADQIDRAVSDFESGNVRLSVALSLLK